VLRIPPLGDVIGRCFQIFIDDRDEGAVILTHIYLLVGCSCPLWLHSGMYQLSSLPAAVELTRFISWLDGVKANTPGFIAIQFILCMSVVLLHGGLGFVSFWVSSFVNISQVIGGEG